jgi:hypothetical protein
LILDLSEARTAADMLAFSKFWYHVRSHAESVVLCPGEDQVTGRGSFEYAFGSVQTRQSGPGPER